MVPGVGPRRRGVASFDGLISINDSKGGEASSYLPLGESIVDMWEKIEEKRDVKREIT